MKIPGLAALGLAIAAPALAQTSPSGGIGSLTPPATQTPAPDQAQGPATVQPAPASRPNDRSRPVQPPSNTSNQ